MCIGMLCFVAIFLDITQNFIQISPKVVFFLIIDVDGGTLIEYASQAALGGQLKQPFQFLQRHDKAHQLQIIRRNQFKFVTARTHRNLTFFHFGRTDKAFATFHFRNTEPNRARPDNAGLAQHQIGIFFKKLYAVEPHFKNRTFKGTRMQLIVQLLPRSEVTRLLIGIVCNDFFDIECRGFFQRRVAFGLLIRIFCAQVM